LSLVVIRPTSAIYYLERSRDNVGVAFGCESVGRTVGKAMCSFATLWILLWPLSIRSRPIIEPTIVVLLNVCV